MSPWQAAGNMPGTGAYPEFGQQPVDQLPWGHGHAVVISYHFKS
jgi:hypothetical protein